STTVSLFFLWNCPPFDHGATTSSCWPTCFSTSSMPKQEHNIVLRTKPLNACAGMIGRETYANCEIPYSVRTSWRMTASSRPHSCLLYHEAAPPGRRHRVPCLVKARLSTLISIPEQGLRRALRLGRLLLARSIRKNADVAIRFNIGASDLGDIVQ